MIYRHPGPNSQHSQVFSLSPVGMNGIPKHFKCIPKTPQVMLQQAILNPNSERQWYNVSNHAKKEKTKMFP